MVNISNPSSRAIATRVIPACSAVRMASAVGAEIATMREAPSTAVMCTSSTETRLVSTTKLVAPAMVASREVADQLVERVVSPDILPHRHKALAGNEEARGMHRPRRRIQRLRSDEQRQSARDEARRDVQRMGNENTRRRYNPQRRYVG